ncbi:hypothetical protein CMI44_00945 [Candidatus Pacearchaeota archaeon]|jgi:hypothetical protein|nr:hypothetical protein [Candidatus Pacearchaeota archaeon]|tara:strand:+ start:811 stop:1146 length:336 start_codon:yes stop_codon:yes gene_type:complete
MAKNKLVEITIKNKEQINLIEKFIGTNMYTQRKADVPDCLENIITLLGKGVFLLQEYIDEFYEEIWDTGIFFDTKDWKEIGGAFNSVCYKKIAHGFYIHPNDIKDINSQMY